MHLINQKANKEIPEKVEKFVKDVCSDIKTSKQNYLFEEIKRKLNF